MAVKNFKEKGFSFERKLAERIGIWYCGDKRSLWRNTSSGARCTVVGDIFGGDIVPANGSVTSWPLCIEAKKSEGFSVDGFLQGNPSEPLLEHMLQCLSASQVGCNKFPILICKKNRQKALCFLYAPLCRPYIQKNVFLARLRWPEAVPGKLLKKYPWSGTVDFYCLHLETFFHQFSQKDFA